MTFWYSLVKVNSKLPTDIKSPSSLFVSDSDREIETKDRRVLSLCGKVEFESFHLINFSKSKSFSAIHRCTFRDSHLLPSSWKKLFNWQEINSEGFLLSSFSHLLHLNDLVTWVRQMSNLLSSEDYNFQFFILSKQLLPYFYKINLEQFIGARKVINQHLSTLKMFRYFILTTTLNVVTLSNDSLIHWRCRKIDPNVWYQFHIILLRHKDIYRMEIKIPKTIVRKRNRWYAWINIKFRKLKLSSWDFYSHSKSFFVAH